MVVEQNVEMPYCKPTLNVYRYFLYLHLYYEENYALLSYF